jgi:hypothetical protein
VTIEVNCNDEMTTMIRQAATATLMADLKSSDTDTARIIADLKGAVREHLIENRS